MDELAYALRRTGRDDGVCSVNIDRMNRVIFERKIVPIVNRRCSVKHKIHAPAREKKRSAIGKISLMKRDDASRAFLRKKRRFRAIEDMDLILTPREQAFDQMTSQQAVAADHEIALSRLFRRHP